jgi:two-component system response regulator HydG
MKKNKEINILVIDDDQMVHELIRVMLKDSKYNILSSNNGTDGIKTFIKNKIDIVILDINMPGIDGRETLSRLKMIDNNVDVIMCTGDSDLRQKLYNDGAIAYITKPIYQDNLLNIIDMVLKLQKVV